MNKFKIMAIAVGILIFAEGAGLIYLVYSKQGLSKQIDEVAPGLKKRISELQAQKKEAEDESRKLKSDNEAIMKDRENLLAQAKFLMKDKGRVKELEDSLAASKESEDKLLADKENLEKMLKIEREKFAAEHVELKKQNAKLQGVVKQLMYIQKEVEAERDYLQEAYDKLKDTTTIKEFKKTISELTKQNKQQDNKLKLAERESDKLKDLNKKADERINDLEKDLDEYKSNYADALKKNKAMEQEIRNMPKKFSEIARQNKALVKETAKTHYNLGVFYTKNKEYSRAAAEFAKAVEINPDDAYSHFNLGYIYAEHMLDRRKALEHFRHFLRLAKGDDKDVDWVRRYVLTWDTYEGKSPFK